MPASKTLIANMALAHCGVNARIQDVESERSNEANQCRLFFEHIIGVILETCEWPFAMRRVALQDLGSPPVGWGKRYKYPANCKLAIRIVNPAARTEGAGQSIPFKVMDEHDGYGKVILTDQEDAELEFNAEILDPAKFSSTFTSAAALGLGAHIAMPLRVDAQIAKYVQQQWSNWLAEAVNQKQREQREDVEPDSEFERVRG